MDTRTMHAAIEAQFLMGHCVPGFHVAMDRTTITDWSWDVDEVRQRLHVPLNALWGLRVLELEMQGLASFSFYTEPLIVDEEGNEDGDPDWQDQPRDKWGSMNIHARGVLRLAELYGRPYVKLKESPALFAHWQLIQAESKARRTPHDQAQWEAEWPERAILLKAWIARRDHADEG